MENGMFWSEIGSGFGEPGDTPPPRIPRSTPRVFMPLICPVKMFFNSSLSLSREVGIRNGTCINSTIVDVCLVFTDYGTQPEIDNTQATKSAFAMIMAVNGNYEKSRG